LSVFSHLKLPFNSYSVHSSPTSTGRKLERGSCGRVDGHTRAAAGDHAAKGSRTRACGAIVIVVSIAPTLLCKNDAAPHIVDTSAHAAELLRITW
jgi:hypothetical protein